MMTLVVLDSSLSERRVVVELMMWLIILFIFSNAQQKGSLSSKLLEALSLFDAGA